MSLSNCHYVEQSCIISWNGFLAHIISIFEVLVFKMNNLYIRIRYEKFMAYMIALFPITTLLQGINIFMNINKVVMFALIIFLVVGLFSKPIEHREFAIFGFGISLGLIAIIITGKPMFFNPLIYFPFWILFFVVMARDYRDFISLVMQEQGLLKKILLAWEAIVVVSIFFSRSYSYDWGDKYFTSFAGSPHRFASSCLVMLAFAAILYVKTIEKKYLFHFLAINIGMFFCGARTYLVVGFIYLLAFFYVILKNKKIFYYSLLPIIGIALVVILLTPIGTKFLIGFQGSGYYGYWATLTSGRSVLWVEDLAGYWDLNFFKKLVGNGTDFVYELNMEGTFRRAIYAHNEFINLLCSHGILGLFAYFWAFYNFVNRAKQGSKIALIPMLGFYTIIYFNAFFNMVYTYPNAVVAIPFIYYSLSYHKQSTDENKE